MKSITEEMTCSLGGVLCIEQRGGARRTGFTAVLHGGREATFMSRFGKDCPIKVPLPDDAVVGKYIVSVRTIDDFVVPELERCLEHCPGLVYIDEIGKAQAHSSAFFHVLRKLFDTNCNILATVVESDTPWSIEYKYNPQYWLIPVTTENREELAPVLLSVINNVSLFEQLTPSRQLEVKRLFFRMLESNKFVSARKLFSNALSYVIEGRVERVFASEVEAVYYINGSTGAHIVKMDFVSGKFTCDCDLSNCRGSFKHLLFGEPCSHEFSILIWGS